VTSPKRVPVEVVAKARAVTSALTKQYTLAPAPAAEPQPKKKQQPAREKVVAALKRLHPMD
jgi:hypothetical protein